MASLASVPDRKVKYTTILRSKYKYNTFLLNRKICDMKMFYSCVVTQGKRNQVTMKHYAQWKAIQPSLTVGYL